MLLMLGFVEVCGNSVVDVAPPLRALVVQPEADAMQKGNRYVLVTRIQLFNWLKILQMFNFNPTED